VTALDGYVGLSMLADRASGRCIATTAWDSEEAMHDSEGPLHMLRRRYGEILGGRPEVQEWEIAVLHRLRPAPDGAPCRVVWSRGAPEAVDHAMDVFRMGVLPRMSELPGFCSVSMMMDRETGRAVSATVFDSRDAIDRTAAGGDRMRAEYARQTGGEITEVAEFDLVLAHLRVPETV
jgi:heme-degrading monooxygenase HmoA